MMYVLNTTSKAYLESYIFLSLLPFTTSTSSCSAVISLLVLWLPLLPPMSVRIGSNSIFFNVSLEVTILMFWQLHSSTTQTYLYQAFMSLLHHLSMRLHPGTPFPSSRSSHMVKLKPLGPHFRSKEGEIWRAKLGPSQMNQPFEALC